MYKMIFRNPNNYQCVTGGELYHHGILGQKWGIRRFQKKDGSLTAAGKKRYSSDQSSYENNKNTYNFENLTNTKEFSDFMNKNNGGVPFDKIEDPELKELCIMEYTDYVKDKMLNYDIYPPYNITLDFARQIASIIPKKDIVQLCDAHDEHQNILAKLNSTTLANKANEPNKEEHRSFLKSYKVTDNIMKKIFKEELRDELTDTSKLIYYIASIPTIFSGKPDEVDDYYA